METNELYLKTAFCCMACDGEIAEEEIRLLKEFANNSSLFKGLEINEKLNEFVSQINATGQSFLTQFINELQEKSFDEEEELALIKIAIKTIEADNEIQYSEIKFFKRIRGCLNISDEKILKELPDKEDYLLPDIVQYDTEFSTITDFTKFDLLF